MDATWYHQDSNHHRGGKQGGVYVCIIQTLLEMFKKSCSLQFPTIYTENYLSLILYTC